MMRLAKLMGVVVLSGLLLVACTGGAPADKRSGTISVIATTSIIGDVVQQVGGEAVAVEVLLAADTDPHTFEPTPRQVAAMTAADVIFINGFGLEEALQPVLDGVAAEGVRIESVSEGIKPLRLETGGDEHEGKEGGGVDPHVWLDPTNVMIWADNIARVLGELEPSQAENFAANAHFYRSKLEKLDAWIRQQFAPIPPSQRKLVTDHAVFNYFVRRYDLRQIGTVMPGFSTVAVPAAQEMAALEDLIRREQVPAIFVGTTVNPALAERIARDTGAQVVFVYTGSLSGAEGPAATYLDMMRYDVQAIVGALRF